MSAFFYRHHKWFVCRAAEFRFDVSLWGVITVTVSSFVHCSHQLINKLSSGSVGEGWSSPAECRHSYSTAQTSVGGFPDVTRLPQRWGTWSEVKHDQMNSNIHISERLKLNLMTSCYFLSSAADPHDIKKPADSSPPKNVVIWVKSTSDKCWNQRVVWRLWGHVGI